MFFLDNWFGKQELGVGYYVKLFTVYGPALTAITVTACTSGKAGLAALFSKLKPDPKHFVWWLTLPVAGTLITIVAFAIQGIPAYTLFTMIINNLSMFAAHIILATLIIGFGEEIGWRGWLWPTLLKTRTVKSAILFIFIAWGLWHLPILFMGYKTAIPFVILVLSMSVILAWIWQRVNGNIFVLAIAHASVDFPEAFFEQRVLASAHNWDYILGMWAILSVVYAAVAIVVFLLPGWTNDVPADKNSKNLRGE
jgi:membrane protease YdiL (CAAX protease family)